MSLMGRHEKALFAIKLLRVKPIYLVYSIHHYPFFHTLPMRPIITVFFFLLSLSSYAQDDRFECNDSCSAGSTGIATFNVVSPVGFSTVEPIEMAPRLSTLDGKTIAIVGEDFMYNITHPELKRLILESYPTANIILYDELPIAGPYPAPAISSAKRTPSSYRNGRSNMYDMKGQRLVRKPQRGGYIQEGRKKLSR